MTLKMNEYKFNSSDLVYCRAENELTFVVQKIKTVCAVNHYKSKKLNNGNVFDNSAKSFMTRLLEELN